MSEELNDLEAIVEGLEQFKHDHIWYKNNEGIIRFEGEYNKKFKNFVKSVEDDESIRWNIKRVKLDVNVIEVNYDNCIIIFSRKDDDEMGIETQRLAEYVHDYLDNYEEE